MPNARYIYFDVSQTGLTSWQFCERALHDVDVALTPGRDFGECGADTYVRLSYAASAAGLQEAIERLGGLMDCLKKAEDGASSFMNFRVARFGVGCHRLRRTSVCRAA